MIEFSYLTSLGVTAAAMSDRHDGDCALRPDGVNEATLQNRAALCRHFGLDPHSLVGARQVHGDHVAIVDHTHAGSGLALNHALADTDGLATAEHLLLLSITVADCAPVFIIDPDAWLGALVHAGRAGTQRDISGRAVSVLEAIGAAPRRLHALIGPSAGPCCYQVGEEIAAELDRAGVIIRDGHADLWESNRRQLIAAGVAPENIVVDGRCTICDGRFHSHRAHADGQRNVAILAL